MPPRLSLLMLLLLLLQVLLLTSAPLMHLTTSHLCIFSAVEATS
jgi:hypothetical protein